MFDFKSKKGYPRFLKVKNELFLLYLRGLRGNFNRQSVLKPYNFYHRIFSFGFVIIGFAYLKHKLQNEFEQMRHSNIFIPKFIYQSRRDHFIYWEMSRLARGKSTTFTHYEWDPDSKMIYYIDREGNQRFEKNNFNKERLDIINNPLFETIYKNKLNNEEQFELGNKLIAYHLNIYNKYDLDNYLHDKSIRISDVLRALYQKVWITLGLSNRYRYEHFIRKPDFIYDYEKIKLGLNFQGKNQNNQLKYLITFHQHLSQTINQQLQD